MLYSDNAPDLENALHKHFAGRELNLVNHRKEFYRGIKLQEIEEFVKGRGLSAQFVSDTEAKEYRESLALRAQQAVIGAESKNAKEQPAFPTALFATP